MSSRNSRTNRPGGFAALNSADDAHSAAQDRGKDADQFTSRSQRRWADNPFDDPQTRIINAVKRNGILAVSVLAALIVGLMAMSTSSGRAETLDEQEARILSLEQAVKLSKSEKNKDYAQVISQATGGIDSEHRAADEKVARDLFSTALTWDGMSAYAEAREEVMRAYDMDEDSDFMKSFMPGEIQGAMRTAPNGKTYYAEGSDLNSRFSDLSTTITGVNGDVYSYWGLVTMRVQSDSGQTSTPMYATVTFDVVDGKIKNVRGETAPLGVEKTS